MAHPEEITLSVFPHSGWPEVCPVWSELAQVSADVSFFNSPEWVETWLSVFGLRLRTELMIFRAGSCAVGACIVVWTTERRGPIPVRRVYFHTAGEGAAHETCPEFNAVLCREGFEEAVSSAMVSYLLSKKWDELVLRGFCAGGAADRFRSVFREFSPEYVEASSYFVDLADLRSANSTYESTLGSSTRKHLRQNLRQYAKSGQIAIKTAETAPEAQALLKELAALHQKHWTQRGHPGVFASREFTEFHRRLIASSFAHGFIQIMRAAAGDETIGILYNFVYKNKVYFYQSGFTYSDNKRLSPGTVSLSLAVEHCLQETALDEYHFLAGDSQYKRTLSNKCRNLVSLVLRRPTLRSRLVACLVGVRQGTEKIVQAIVNHKSATGTS